MILATVMALYCLAMLVHVVCLVETDALKLARWTRQVEAKAYAADRIKSLLAIAVDGYVLAVLYEFWRGR